MLSFCNNCSHGEHPWDTADGIGSGNFSVNAANAVEQVAPNVTPAFKVQMGPLACLVAATAGGDSKTPHDEDEDVVHFATAEGCVEENEEETLLPVETTAAPRVANEDNFSQTLLERNANRRLYTEPAAATSVPRTRAATTGNDLVEATSRASWQLPWGSTLSNHKNDPRVWPIWEAARKARIAEAHRALRELEASGANACKLLGPELFERINRVGDCYEASLQDLREAPCDLQEGAMPDAAWRELSKGEEMASAYKFTNENLQVMASMTFMHAEIDVFKAFVGLCEHDLADGYNEAQVHSQRLWPKLGDSDQFASASGDGLWQAVRRPQHGGKEDNIFHVSCVDALDDKRFGPMGALWFAIYTPEPEPETTEPAEVTSPRAPENSLV